MTAQREWFEKDYYATLGVPNTASEKEITRAYRKLAKQHHPDANPGNGQAEERFKEISTAYDVLGDAEKHKEYDEARRQAASGFRGFGGTPGGQGFRFDANDLGGASGLGDLLGGLFNRGRPQQPGAGGVGPRRGDDLEAQLYLSFRDAIDGITTTVRLESEAPCSKCAGTGAAPGTVPKRCDLCGGTGAVARNQGPFSFSELCPRCNGTGRLVEHPCPTCRGRGTETRQREVRVRIPPGVADQQRIRVKGRGAPGLRGGSIGDLYVTVHVEPHPVFQRRGDDLLVRIPITFPEATLGAEVTVPTLDGKVTVRVPPGSPSGKTLRVRNKGVSVATKKRGDLLVTLDVIVPKTLTKEQRKAVEALASVADPDPRAHLGV